MNKKAKYLQIAATSLLAVAVSVAAVGCGGDDEHVNNPETRPLVMSISTPDGVFNPFFGTSAYDTTLTSLTQIGMLGSNSAGELVWGDKEPVVVKDYKSTYNASSDTTTYEFILKNGIKFSDGSPLTIKDVLFNLYTYLDPAYTGSATIYSTKIVGLEAYRTQNPNASEGSMESFEEGFYTDANIRIDELIDFVYVNGIYNGTDHVGKTEFTEEETAKYTKDFGTVAAEFKKELETDWNTSAESKDSYKDWGFTETWQIFLLNDGEATELLAKNPDGTYIKDDNGNFKLDQTVSDEYQLDLQDWIDEHEEYSMDENGIKAWAIDWVYGSYFRGTIQNTQATQFEKILRGWATADTIRDRFAAEAKSEHFASLGASGRPVKKIEGIDGKGTTTKDFSGKNLGESHEVLKITIRGIDPKAIWNFGFTVSPMNYYSTHDYKGKDYINSFNEDAGEFGLAFGDLDFMEKVINAPEKVGLPVGAGVYMASNERGDQSNVNAGSFFDKNMVYFERNPYFETVGDDSIHNAKIKYVRYKVVETDQIINSLGTGEIDFGEPNGTQENISALNNKGIAHDEIKTNGYGYVGINPRYVPDITVRRAIMRAMDTSIIVNNYYKGDLAELIYRPMSNTSWAYPKGVGVYKNEAKGLDYSFDPTGLEIEDMLEDAGYVKNAQGIYKKDLAGFGTVTLDYTFTIAGSTSDHPAYAMFNEAMKLLNKHGFKIKVVTSQTALSDLTTGKLTVWAAAWSSTIDPDMYQVYHKDSLATSVNNWGYRQIKANKTLYATEWNLIQQLSQLIDDGRATDVQKDRETIYAQALDLIMELAVEFPTYQRKDMSAYNSKILDRESMKEKTTAYEGLLARIWELDYI